MSNKKDILTFIDRGEWKHSWHLNRNAVGEIIWWDEDNIRAIRRVIDDGLVESQRLRAASIKASRALNDLLAELVVVEDSGCIQGHRANADELMLRTRDACRQLVRYRGTVFSSELLVVLDMIANINDDLHNARDPELVKEGVEKAKRLLDAVCA